MLWIVKSLLKEELQRKKTKDPSQPMRRISFNCPLRSSRNQAETATRIQYLEMMIDGDCGEWANAISEEYEIDNL
jgi:hypothetical protein